MEQCKLCNNFKECNKYHWVVTMDRNRVFINGDYVCDNFKTDKNIIILQKSEAVR